MIAGWLLYCLGVSALLAVAAAAVDAVLTRRGRPARWVWVVAMAGSFVFPAAAYVQQHLAPPASIPVGVNEMSNNVSARFPSRVLDAPRDPWQPVRAIVARRPRAPEPSGTERVATLLAIACILIAALRVMFESVLLYRSRRSWTPDVVDGVAVLVSENLGPAIVGLIEPKIVLPRWTLSLERDDRDLMLTHEREHVRTNDGRLTTAALLAVIAMPWNPAMWYALRRLRTAIEVDCDRRVLRAFPDVRRYGHLLVDVAQRAVGSSLAIAGFSERASPVARRIQAMTATMRRGTFADDFGSGAIGALAIVGSFALLPPEAPPRSTSWPNREAVTAKYVGDSIAEEPQLDTAGGSVPARMHLPRIVGAAHDLPVSFVVDGVAHARPTGPTDASCPDRLRDERDSTILRVSMSTTGVSSVVERGDTAWTRVRSVGYYYVSPDGRYGVMTAREQTLRVGCGGLTRITVAGQRIKQLRVRSTLDTPDDDRARLIGREVLALIHVEPLAIELYDGRLEVVVGDTAAIAPGKDAPWDFTHAIFARSRGIIGRATMPETLAVSVRRSRDQWITMYYYNSMAK